MAFPELIPVLAGSRLLPGQIDNLTRLLAASRHAFSNPEVLVDISSDTAVIESGHQPNFLPYPGIFRKAALTEALVNLAESRGSPVIGLFGLADQNLSTAPRLTSSRIPAVNRDGFERLGFKVAEKDRWNQFCRVEKPPADVWEKKIAWIRDFYLKSLQDLHRNDRVISERIDRIIDLAMDEYGKADNFADLNAALFAAVCRHCFKLNRIFFFRYSDVQENSVFLAQAQQIARARDAYVATHNKARSALGITTIDPLPAGHVPFWYHCACGKKLELSLQGSRWRASCDSCQREYVVEPDNLAPAYRNLGFTAVSRNLAFAEGLGTTVFVSGTGGSLVYGRLSAAIGRYLGFRIPATVAWGGRDYYLGPQQVKALRLLKQAVTLEDSDFETGIVQSRIDSHVRSLTEELERLKGDDSRKPERKNIQGQINNAGTQVAISQKLFSVIPSILDLLVAADPGEILRVWNEAMRDSEMVDQEGVGIIKRDCVYSTLLNAGIEPSLIPSVYRTLVTAEVHP
jgi:hypothetical protein